MGYGPRRKPDPKLLAAVKQMPCLVGHCCFGPVDPAHIRSRGAGGPDEGWNIVPFCRAHHSEQHALGWRKFLDRYRKVWLHLSNLGWEVIYTGLTTTKMHHPKLRRNSCS